MAIRAVCYTDDRVYEVNFDAEAWFNQAKPDEYKRLLDCGCGGDYPADEVARYMAQYNDELSALFKYLEHIANIPSKKDVCGFECHINQEDVKAWDAMATLKRE